MKIVSVEDAVGMVLCHDMTRIVSGETKGPAFRKGHIVADADIPTLLEIGKEHIYVLDIEPGQIHEDEAALRIAQAAAGPGITFFPVCEGRINFKAERGLLDVNVEALKRINSIEEIVLATVHAGQQVTVPHDVAGTRVVPLVVDEAKIELVEAICTEYPYVVGVRPIKHRNIGVVTTGREVFLGRIIDQFGPVIRKKFSLLGSTVMGQRHHLRLTYLSRRHVHDSRSVRCPHSRVARLRHVLSGFRFRPCDSPSSGRGKGDPRGYREARVQRFLC